VELTILGCSGTYGAPAGGACSGYLLRSDATTVWVDCGSGTLVNLAYHVPIEELTGIVVSHSHVDHWMDLSGYLYACRYGFHRRAVPVYAAPMVADQLRAVVGDFADVFAWTEIDEHARIEIGSIACSFSRTDHPVPTFAVAAEADGKRVVYSADTGPGWSPTAFERADLLLIEASLQDATPANSVHLTARQAGERARAANARKVVLTHVFPLLDPAISAAEAADAFGDEVMLAAPHLTLTV